MHNKSTIQEKMIALGMSAIIPFASWAVLLLGERTTELEDGEIIAIFALLGVVAFGLLVMVLTMMALRADDTAFWRNQRSIRVALCGAVVLEITAGFHGATGPVIYLEMAVTLLALLVATLWRDHIPEAAGQSVARRYRRSEALGLALITTLGGYIGIAAFLPWEEMFLPTPILASVAVFIAIELALIVTLCIDGARRAITTEREKEEPLQTDSTDVAADTWGVESRLKGTRKEA